MISALEPKDFIRGLIFDLDGTLADTMPLHLDAWKATAEYWDVAITAKMINDRLGIPTIQVIQELNELYNWSVDPVAFRLKKNEFYVEMKRKKGKIQPIDSVAAIARKYHGQLPMSIGTGSIKKNATAALSDLNMSDHFVAVITAEDVERHKPDPSTFLKCAQAMSVQPSECLVYEDSPLGIEAALSGGMHAVNIITHEVFHP